MTRIRAERTLRHAQDENPRERGRIKQVPSYERERIAGDAEMRRALVKSLQAFGVRVMKEDLKPPPRHSGESENPAGSTQTE